MAKKKKGARGGAGRLWQAEPDDAIRLAALRWFAIEIERKAIEIYATDKSRYLDLEALLRHTMKKMNIVSDEIAEPEECPIGYVLCKDGMCAPACDHLGGEESPES